MDNRFSLRTFGTAALLDSHGHSLPLRKKDLALLIYLRLEARPCPRSFLAGLLWGEAPEAKARHSLTQTIGRLRDLLGHNCVVPTNGDLLLACDLDCDADRLLNRGPFNPEEYRGDFLVDFAPGPGAESFTDWADGKRTLCRLRMTKLLDELGGAAEQDGHSGEALQIGLQLTQIEPSFEEGHRRVMRAWRALGERTMALRHYERMRDWLQTEIGAEPDSTSQLLANRIREEQHEADVAPADGRAQADHSIESGRHARAKSGALVATAIMAVIALTASGWAVLDGRRSDSTEPAIIFESDRSGSVETYRAIPGRSLTRFDPEKPGRFDPYWSPAAQRLAVDVRTADGLSDVVLISDDGDSTFIAPHASTDQFAAWAPDGNTLLLVSYRAGTGDLLAASTDGKLLRAVVEGPHEEDRACWSPRGDLIAFRSTRAGRRELWVSDADGQNARRILEGGDPLACAFSADGERLAFIAMKETRALYVWHVASARTEKLLEDAASMHWAADGVWMAVQVDDEGGGEIYRVRSDGVVIENISRDTAQERLIGWTHSGTPRFIARVDVSAPGPLRVAVAERRRLTATAFDSNQRYFAYDSFRWSSLDTAVVDVTASGIVIGRAPGRGRIVASAGGWRSDTVEIVVIPRQLSVLLREDFERDLATNWIEFGEPRPQLRAGRGAHGSRGFHNSGDATLESGIISRKYLPTDAGLTVEFDAHGPRNWRLHNLFGVDLIALRADTAGLGAGRVFADARRTAATLWWIGGYDTKPQLRFGRIRPDDPTDGLRDWRRIALQLRPDGFQELYVDGVFVAESPPQDRRFAEIEAVQLVLGYRSASGDVMHDNVTVYRGLKHARPN